MAQVPFAAQRENADLQKLILYHTTTGIELGRGAYGSSKEVKVDGLVCVGKMFHESLFINDAAVAEVTNSNFVKVCRILSDIRHPHLVQFLGLCFAHNYPLPILVTEKLEGDIQSLLQTVPNVPMILKLSLLEDVVRGLHYLHSFSPALIHGDLTSRNVLYTSSLVAKISDVGNSQLFNLPDDSEPSQTTPPAEYLAYMPPESKPGHHKNTKFDIFSFGHLALCTLTQMFDENREKHFQTVERTLPTYRSLLITIKECLNNKPECRPMASQLLTSLDRMKSTNEGSHTTIAKTNAVSQVLTALNFARIEHKLKESEEAHSRTLEELQCKDRVIQELGSKLKQQDRSNGTEQNVETSGVMDDTAGPSTADLKDIELILLCGYFANPRKEPTAEGYTHDWYAYVGSENSKDGYDIKHVVKKVVFDLHKDYKPNDKRVIEEPPYKVSVSGYGEFRLPVHIHFTNKEVATFKIHLHLYDTCDVSTVLSEPFPFRRPNKKFREKLILAGGKPCKCLPANHREKGKPKKRVTESKKSRAVNKKRKSVVTGRKRKKPMISDSDSSSDSDLSCVSISSDD